jgi:hypothetical protein
LTQEQIIERADDPSPSQLAIDGEHAEEAAAWPIRGGFVLSGELPTL